MKKGTLYAPWMVAVVCLAGVAGPTHASGSTALFTRDTAYEQYLQVQSNPDDEKITPARVLRWMMGMRGLDVVPRTSTEFQPVVDANEHRVRAVAAFAYKFY